MSEGDNTFYVDVKKMDSDEWIATMPGYTVTKTTEEDVREAVHLKYSSNFFK